MHLKEGLEWETKSTEEDKFHSEWKIAWSEVKKIKMQSIDILKWGFPNSKIRTKQNKQTKPEISNDDNINITIITTNYNKVILNIFFIYGVFQTNLYTIVDHPSKNQEIGHNIEQVSHRILYWGSKLCN